MLANLIE